MLNMLPSAQKMLAELHFDEEHFKQLLRQHRLRPTKQRLIIAMKLFKMPKHHVHADMLHEEIAASGSVISVATIYNSLRAFCAAGLIRAVASRGIRQWFCTDISRSCQFYFDDGEQIKPLDELTAQGSDLWSSDNSDLFAMPLSDSIPEGYQIAHIDVSIHLEKIESSSFTKRALFPSHKFEDTTQTI